MVLSKNALYWHGLVTTLILSWILYFHHLSGDKITALGWIVWVSLSVFVANFAVWLGLRVRRKIHKS